jgi:uncharacterized membrane protein YdbT with pleckstrin-like domain
MYTVQEEERRKKKQERRKKKEERRNKKEETRKKKEETRNKKEEELKEEKRIIIGEIERLLHTAVVRGHYGVLINIIMLCVCRIMR